MHEKLHPVYSYGYASTHCGPVTSCGDIYFGTTSVQVMASCWRRQVITLTNVDVSSIMSSGIHLRLILEEIPQRSITEVR